MGWHGHGGGAEREEEERGEDEGDIEVDAAEPQRQRQGRPRQRVVRAPEHPRRAAYVLLELPRDGHSSVGAHRGGDPPGEVRLLASRCSSSRRGEAFAWTAPRVGRRILGRWVAPPRSPDGRGVCGFIKERAAACVHAGATWPPARRGRDVRRLSVLSLSLLLVVRLPSRSPQAAA